MNHRYVCLLALACAGLGAGPAKAAGGSRSSDGALQAVAASAENIAGAASSAGVPSVSVDSRTDRQYVFWRGNAGRLYEAWYDQAWHGPVTKGWRSASAPSVAVGTSGQLYVFWQGLNGHLYEAWYDQAWRGPTDLTTAQGWGTAGGLSSAPAAAVNGSGSRQYVFWRGTNGDLYEAWYDTAWHGPVATGWKSASAPTVAAGPAGPQALFWQGINRHLYEARYDHGATGARDLTRAQRWGTAGELSSAPGAAGDTGSGRWYVFWRGADRGLHEARYDGRWHSPVRLGWRAASAPAAAVGAWGHLYVFWQGTNRNVWESWYRAGWNGPVDRWSLRQRSGPYVEAVQTTADLVQRLKPMDNLWFAGAPPPGIDVIKVNDGIRYQRFTGVGAAMTDSSAWLIHDELSPATRDALMDDLFGPYGIHLGFMVVPMGASDFTAAGRPYTYDDVAPGQRDPQLRHFSIAHDRRYILPVLRQSLALNPGIKIFATPWTAPPWMKANQAYDDLQGLGTLLPSAFHPLAEYFVKFLRAYAAAGVPVEAIAPENEPTVKPAYPATYVAPADEARWIAQYLAPALHRAKLHPELYGSNEPWSTPAYAPALLASQPGNLLGGIAWHCYYGVPTVMDPIHRQAPGLDQLVSECSPGLAPYWIPELLIGALRNWASAVTLWNLALDPSGGPVQPPNAGCPGCWGVATIDEATHRVSLTPAYFQLGQVSAFVEAGARRIYSNSLVSFYQNGPGNYGATSGLDDVAFLNPDGSRVLVAYNNSSAPISFAVEWHRHTFVYRLPPTTNVTFRWTT